MTRKTYEQAKAEAQAAYKPYHGMSAKQFRIANPQAAERVADFMASEHGDRLFGEIVERLTK